MGQNRPLVFNDDWFNFGQNEENRPIGKTSLTTTRDLAEIHEIPPRRAGLYPGGARRHPRHIARHVQCHDRYLQAREG